MRRFSAQYIITATGQILKRGIITTDDKGRITNVFDTGGEPPELSKTEFYNGIIIPGFVNCHCHLELSGMHNHLQAQTGLGEFIKNLRKNRPGESTGEIKSIADSDKIMYDAGISACGDICNSSLSFKIKEKSPVKYINFLEVFGIDPLKAGKRIAEVINLKEEAGKYSSPSYIVPHSFYSMSATLLKKIKELTSDNEITTVHFKESEQEDRLLKNAVGELMESYKAMGIDPDMLYDRIPDHITGIREYITAGGNLILVHNTFTREEDIQAAAERGNCYFCLCPRSNLFIENTLPPVNDLREKTSAIVIGTDSLASNKSLNMLEEIKLISSNFPSIPLAELVTWATINGARALKIESGYGSIETGKTPGLVLIENADLENLRLKAESRAKRLL
ncbi:MAG: amidohydrolase family protein [Bacteroidales bacterium]|nr:amidohydrolase family protein [Bacteroidales bacterium]